MTEQKDLYIDGKLVTVTNAWRFVKARRPNATAHRERDNSWRGRSDYSVVRDRTGGAPWCHATGRTAGEAWLKVARQMVAYDARVAMEKQALEAKISALTAAETSEQLESAALRYAAVRIEQSNERFFDERRSWASMLRAMADAIGSPAP